MTPEQMRGKFSSFQWTQMMTSGLQRDEVRALGHYLKQEGMPAHAAPFIEIVGQRIYSYGEPTADELEGTDDAPPVAPPPPPVPAGSGPPPPPGAPPPPPPPPSAAPSADTAGRGGAGQPQNPLFAAIEARKQTQEARMRKIESGEMTMVDPRDAREAELRKQTAAKVSEPA